MADNAEIVGWLDAIREYHGFKSDARLADLLGVSRASVSTWRSGATISNGNRQAIRDEYLKANRAAREAAMTDTDRRRQGKAILDYLDGNDLRDALRGLDAVLRKVTKED